MCRHFNENKVNSGRLSRPQCERRIETKALFFSQCLFSFTVVFFSSTAQVCDFIFRADKKKKMRRTSFARKI